MSTTSLKMMAGGSHRTLGWNQVKHSFAEWRSRVRSRSELMGLSDEVLQDIGMSRCSAQFEVSKPFWQA